MMKSLLILISTLLLVIGCKKKLFDYRNQYVGDWKFSYIIANDVRTYAPRCDTLKGEYSGKISYEKSAAKGVLYIEYAPDASYSYNIDKAGNFTDCAASGKFNNSKSVTFVWTTRWECGGGHGVGSYTVTGTRK